MKEDLKLTVLCSALQRCAEQDDASSKDKSLLTPKVVASKGTEWQRDQLTNVLNCVQSLRYLLAQSGAA